MHLTIRAGFIATAALALCLVTAACGQSGHNLTQQELNNANLGEANFANSADLTSLGCSGLDSEPDGYVSCTAKEKDTKNMVQLLCSYGNGAGCKPK